MSSSNLLFLVYIFTFMIALAKSTPIKDVSPLTQSSSSIKFHTNERFVIPFNYADINLKNHSAIVIDLKVGDKEIIIVNNSPLKLGITSFQLIKAKSIPAGVSREEIDNYINNDSYDITVKISSSINSSPTNIDNLVINRLIISITIIKVDNLQVIQVERIEETLIEDHSFNEQKFEHCVRYWLNCSPRFIIILLAAFWLTFISIIFFMIGVSTSKYFSTTTNSYQPIPTN